MKPSFLALAGLLFISASLRAGEPAAEPRFTIEVMASLSKAGCNAGACHGNQNGKGGFRLSLRGQDPTADHFALTRSHYGRRLDTIDPSRSLLLLKPSGKLPHLGGVRLPRDSTEFSILKSWIAAGAKGPQKDAPRLTELRVTPREGVIVAPRREAQLRVQATFSDGSVRDVTQAAVFETSNLNAKVSRSGLVTRRQFGETTIVVRYLDLQRPASLAFIPQRSEFVWDNLPANNFIDRFVYDKLRRLRMTTSPLCSDTVFIRRAYLDALGIPPTAQESRRFVEDQRPDKRSRLIDELLARPEFADVWALRWSDVLRNEEKVLDAKGVKAFHTWIRDAMQGAKPLDQFVSELITSRGSTYKSPAANFYRANRDPNTRGEAVARLFLGVRLQCAKCHNHPYGQWTQDDYYAWAALFSRIDYKIVDNKRRDKFDKNEFIGEQIVLIKDKGEVRNPRTGRTASPRFLGADTPPLKAADDRLAPLAKWLVSTDNRRFARMQSNWIWYHVMGRGLVEPIDDFRSTNPSINPKLLDALADELIAHRFDLRRLVRLIMNSHTYQASSEPNTTNIDDQANFSRAIVRRLTAEQLIDAQSVALDQPARFAGYPMGLRAGQIPGVQKLRRRDQRPTGGDRFLRAFGKPQRLLACDCERSNETTLSQALELASGEALHRRLTAAGARLDRLARSTMKGPKLVDELFWAILSRPPSPDEAAAAARLLEEGDDRFAAIQDIGWALLNAKEFLFRR